MNISMLTARVDALLAISIKHQDPRQAFTEVYNGTLGVMKVIYGQDSSQEKVLQAHIEGLKRGKSPANSIVIEDSIQAIRGVLTSIKAELDSGFIGSLRAALTGEVLTDFIKLARVTLEESGDDAKNVASVLTAAAF